MDHWSLVLAKISKPENSQQDTCRAGQEGGRVGGKRGKGLQALTMKGGGEGEGAHIPQDGSVGCGACMARVQHGVNTGLVILRCMHAPHLQGICRQDLALTVHSGHRLGMGWGPSQIR